MKVVVLRYDILVTSFTVNQNLISNIVVLSAINLVIITNSNPAGAQLGQVMPQIVSFNSNI